MSIAFGLEWAMGYLEWKIKLNLIQFLLYSLTHQTLLIILPHQRNMKIFLCFHFFNFSIPGVPKKFPLGEVSSVFLRHPVVDE